MRYGYFDNEAREYVIDRVDVPVSWTNYIGTQRMGGVFNHTAGGYVWLDSPQYHRITRFRPNGVPMDRPGHYVYLRDADTGEYWSVSWQPTGLPLDKAKYACRHGLSYSKYLCEYGGIAACQTVFIPRDDNVVLWDVEIENQSDRSRALDVFGYMEFSFHHIDMDNQNFQMSLYATGSRYENGAVEYELHYEEDSFQYFTASFDPDGFDCLRDAFIGPYRTETNPLGVEAGKLSGSFEKTGSHCGALQKRIILQPGEKARVLFLLGQGNAAEAKKARGKYTFQEADSAKKALADFWTEKLNRLKVDTPSREMNTSLNLWNLYQSEVNVIFSRFASFIEVGGRTGLGFRDTAQDAMCVPHSNPDMCKLRITQLLHGQVREGYGLHLFDPAWFAPEKKQSFTSPTVVPTPEKSQIIHGLKDVCADDALWVIPAICEYVRETGETEFFHQVIPYADGGQDTVYGHMKKILDFTYSQLGAHGIAKGLRADWNDCLNLGGGESAMVAFLHLWALHHFLSAASHLNRSEDVLLYRAMERETAANCRKVLWNGKWFIRGITGKGAPIGDVDSREGKVHLESNAWGVISQAFTRQQNLSAMDAVMEYLYTPYGLMLNAPAFKTPDDAIGFVTRVYPGVKENGAIFSHPNPWAWVAECMLGRGDNAMKLYEALLPVRQNDKIEIRQSEPYAYCQFIMGKEHTAHGRARHPWMTGSAGWAYYAATRYILGIRPEWDSLTIDPCIPSSWEGFSATRVFRGAVYHIRVENPQHVQKGVARLMVDGLEAGCVPIFGDGADHTVEVFLGNV